MDLSQEALQEALDSRLSSHKDRTLLIAGDCAREEDVKRYVTSTVERFGQLDVRLLYSLATDQAHKWLNTDISSGGRYSRSQSSDHGSGAFARQIRLNVQKRPTVSRRLGFCTGYQPQKWCAQSCLKTKRLLTRL